MRPVVLPVGWHVAGRAGLGGEREALLAGTIPPRPGSFLRFCELLGHRSVTEFNYRYESEQAAQIFVREDVVRGPHARAVAPR